MKKRIIINLNRLLKTNQKSYKNLFGEINIKTWLNIEMNAVVLYTMRGLKKFRDFKYAHKIIKGHMRHLFL